MFFRTNTFISPYIRGKWGNKWEIVRKFPLIFASFSQICEVSIGTFFDDTRSLIPT